MASSQQYISPGSATNGTTSEPLKPSTSSNPTPTSTATATATTPPKTRSSPSPLLPPRVPKHPSLTPHAPLTGTVANPQGSRSPRNMSPDDKKIAQLRDSPNPTALLGAGFALGTSGDGGQKESSPASGDLVGLPHVAAAAAAMDTSASSPTTTSSSNGTTVEGGSSTVTAGPGTTDPALMPDISQYHPIHPQPPKLGDPSATTPVSQFGQNPITPSSPFSPSGGSGGGRGKHQCPNCFKTFTRHHNLKSHLLTHAHEKPYLCNTCQARFRRLHDLKRHSKLHTGERPHVCIRCGRRFARGDALARHSRGDGGCAGRRGSMGGMLDGDGNMMTGMDGDGDDGLDGLEGLMGDGDGDVQMLDNGSGNGDGASDENPRPRVSLPSIRTDLHQQQQQAGQAPMTPASGFSQRHPQHATYPPAGPRTASNSGPSPNSSGGLYPPHARSSFRVDSTVTSPSIQSATTATTAPPSASILSPQGTITDSPSAVSPGMTTATSATATSTAERTQSFSGNYLSVLQPSRPAPPANMAANTNVFAAGMEGVWAYIRTLEDRIKNLEDRLSPVPLGPPPPPNTTTAPHAHAPAPTPTTSAPTA